MFTLKDLAGDAKPVIAYPKTIQFGPIELDGYMLETGEFRQSITSTERALGAEKSKIVNRMLVPRYEGSTPVLGAGAKNPSAAMSLGENLAEIGEKGHTPIIVPVRCPGVHGHNGIAYTIGLPMVGEAWMNVALGGGKYAQQAQELLKLSMAHSLERVYQEAFGVEDSRKTSARLLDWAIKLDAGKHFRLFGGQFHQHFARVTGVAIGHRYAAACLADLVYHRLPEPIYEALKDLNPTTDNGFREFTHSQLMTDDMRQLMREIVAAVTHELANTASKGEDSSSYRKCLARLDKTLPRYRKRGNKPGIYPSHFKAINEGKSEFGNDSN